MLKHIFHSDDAQSSTPSERFQLEGLLAQVVSDMPEAYWAALVKTNGLLVGKYPVSLDLREDQVAAMSVAAQVLGERITKELRHGAFEYSFIAGSTRALLVIALNTTHALAVGLRSEASLQHVLEKLRPAWEALLRVVGTGESFTSG